MGMFEGPLFCLPHLWKRSMQVLEVSWDHLAREFWVLGIACIVWKGEMSQTVLPCSLGSKDSLARGEGCSQQRVTVPTKAWGPEKKTLWPGSKANTVFSKWFLFYFIYLFLFLAVLDLCCCTRAFSSCSDWWLLFVAALGLLIAVASLVVAHGLSCSIACGIFLGQGLNPFPCIGRRILNHCTTREVPPSGF